MPFDSPPANIVEAAWRMCWRKRKLGKKRAAFLAEKLGKRSYLCPECHQYHLTTSLHDLEPPHRDRMKP